MLLLLHLYLGLIIIIIQRVAATTLAAPIKGVNLGGWLVTEQWITPSLYESSNAADEWHLCNALGKQKCQSTLQQHWKSFYGRDDFKDILSAGLNSVRIPLGYWAVDLLDFEPYVTGQYPYLIQAVQWAREFGLSVYVDLHGAPGSQNGQDNSGLIGPVLFATNATNEARSIDVLRNLTEEFTQPQYGNTVVGIELLNEPRVGSARFSMDQLKEFYAHGISQVHGSSGESSPNVTIHDAFFGPAYWLNYNPESSASARPVTDLTIDTHQYYAFAPLNNLTESQIIDAICNTGKTLKNPSSGIPPTVVGEWSLQTNIRASTLTSPQSRSDDQARRTWYRLLAEAQMVAYSPNGPDQSSIGWIFWAWKTEWDIDTWSYRKGVADGYIPSNASDPAMYVFPVREDGCVDASFDYTAPRQAGSAAFKSRLHWPLMALAVGLAVFFPA